MREISCEECRLLLSDFLSGEAGIDASASAESHLASCGACRATAQDLVWQDLAISELAGRERTKEILGRFHDSLSAHKARVRRPVRSRSSWWIVAAAASVLIGAGVLLSLGSPAAPPVESPEPSVVHVEDSAPPPDLPVPFRARPRPVQTPPVVEPNVEPAPAPRPAPPPAAVPPEKPAPVPPPEKPPAVAPRKPAPAPPAKPATVPVVAKLIRLRGAVFADGKVAKEGQDLLEGRSLEVREGAGRTQVRFADGTELDLRAGTKLGSVSGAEGKEIVIDRGTVLARVKPQPKDRPMVFRTPHGNATVLGTTLRLVVAPEADRGTRLDVREGRVRMERTADGRSVVVPGGQYVVAAPGVSLNRRKLLPPLQELATAMKPGTWAELVTDGFETDEILVKPWMHVLVETDEAMWDPVKRQLHVVGYTSQDETAHFVYDELNNFWTRRKTDKATSWYGPGYDHLAFHPASQALFFRQHNHDLVHQLDVRTGTWSSLPRMPSNPAAIGALEYFPEMGGLVFAGGGTVYLYRFRSKRWEVLAQALEVGPSDAITEYDPVHRVMLIGGGKGNRTFYRLDPSGTVAKLGEAPIALGLKDALIVTEPAGGKMLVMSRPDGERFYEYDVLSDRWTELGKPDVPVMLNTRRAYTTAAQIPRWGVVMYLVADEKESHVYLYRHGRPRR